MRAPLPFRNGRCPFISFLKKRSIEDLPFLFHTIKGVGSLIIHHHIHSPSYFRFLLHKNSLSPKLKSPPPPLLAARPHMSLRHLQLRLVSPPPPLLAARPHMSFRHLQLRLVRSQRASLPPPSIHGGLSRIIVTIRSNSGEFLPLQIHRKHTASHSLQYLHSVHIIFHTKIKSKFQKNPRNLHQHHCLFEKFHSNLWF
jgi:hypothetical protein